MKPLILTLTLAFAQTLCAADWPQFRGPNGDGIANDANLPITLAPENVAWKIALPGRGLSCPIVVSGRVIVTCSSGPRQERLHVVCLNAADGSVRWQRQFWATGRTMCHDKTSVAASTPVSDGKRVVALFSSNDTVCLDLEGNLIWLRGLTRDYPNVSNSLGMAASPVWVDNTVVAQVENDSESYCVGLDPETGRNRWRLNRPIGANWTSPVVMRDGPRTLVGLQSKAGVDAIEPATGKTVWSYTDGAATIPSSVSDGETIYIPSNGITALRPSAGGQPSQLWRNPQLGPATASPIALGNRLFTLNAAGVLNCANTVDGARLWQLRLKGPFSSTPVAAGKHLYCFGEKGHVQVVDTTAPEGKVVGELNLAEMILATPAVADGAIYARSNVHLWKISKR
ncbi:MAG: pyrrolo-quinoline quinone [Pedosphaera sp.]|nr:pyrrolo-quinoline quinone [Pedosphaera sp.]